MIRFAFESASRIAASRSITLRATDAVSVVAAVGRAFRAPNLIERFFDGSATGGYQVANPDLTPETSTNVDLGLRYRTERVGIEVFGFRNQIRDGIRIAALDDQVDGQDAFQNVNVERLRYQGIEVSGDVRFGGGIMVLGSYSTLDSEDVDDPENPVGDSFSSKTTAALRYDAPSRRFWAQIDGRWQGEQREVDLGDNPLIDIYQLRFLQALEQLNLSGNGQLAALRIQRRAARS